MQANSLLLTGVEAPAAAAAVGRFAETFSAASATVVGALAKLQFLNAEVVALRGQANSSWHLLRGASPLLDEFYQCGWCRVPALNPCLCVWHCCATATSGFIPADSQGDDGEMQLPALTAHTRRPADHPPAGDTAGHAVIYRCPEAQQPGGSLELQQYQLSSGQNS
jgi:hypothetical protein